MLLLLRHPGAKLFPYTTLFRSVPDAHLECLRPVLVAHVEDLDARLGPVGQALGGEPGAGVGLHADVVVAGRGLEVLTLRSEEHTSELQSRRELVCRLLLETKKH